MSDINANIGVNFDTAQALAELKNLQRQLSQFHTSISRTSESAAIAQKNLQTNLLNSVNATGNFIAQMGVIKTSTESFTHALENNKLSMREYFRYAGGASKTFGTLFANEFNTIGRVAEERVKRLQTQYIKMGRDTTGAMKAMAIMPASLDMNSMSTKLQIAAQKQAIFNQLLKQGSTQLLNFGKNTQWAGRQLMVGFTVPLIAFGSAATKSFQDIESAIIKFKKVYGDLGTSQQETDAVLSQIRSVADAFTKYGVAVKDTIALSADAAAAGYKNQDLIAQTTQATKLSVLGQIDQQQALQTTISLQSAFGISAENLASTIDFLNSVENQTVLSLDDITTAIPKVAPIIQQLGGDVKDLSFFMTAMKEGGVNASEGANALKSGLASLINPSTKAKEMLQGLGINIAGIIEKDKGNLKKTVLDVAAALDTLEPLTRARAIEQMFGKFQFARMSTLFDNINKQGTQASRVLDLMGMSASDLASITDKELGVQGASALTKFRGAIEKLKATLAPVGELFMKIFTPVIDSISGLLDKFNNLSDGAKKAIGIIVAVIGGIAPVALMTFGLLSNAFANAVKLFATLRAGYQRLTGGSRDLGQQTQYLTTEQLDAAAAAHSLDQSHAKLIQTFTAEAGAVNSLRGAYARATVAAEAFKLANPGMMVPTARKKFATGGIVSGPGTGTSDSIPAMVSNGEAIVPAKNVKKYPGLTAGLVAGNIPGFKDGKLPIGDLKKSLGLFKAPSAILRQTGSRVWETLPAEIEAALAAAEEVMMAEQMDVVKMGKKLGNLKRRQASHIAPDVTTQEVGGQKVDIKNWKAENLVSDVGYVNNYLNSIQTSTKILDNFNKNHIDKAAADLGMTVKEVETEVEKFKQGIHPTTRQSAQVLQKVAQSDPGYQGRAAAAGLGVRLKGDFYETLGSRAYDPAGDASAAKTVAGKVARLEKAILSQIALATNNVVDGVIAEAQIKSPSRKARMAGQEIARGGIAGIVDEVRNARAAGQKLGVAATTGVISGGIGGTVPPVGGTGDGGGNDGGDSNPKKTRMSLGQLNNALMGTSFALTTVSSMGSMAGGALGELSNQVMKYSGILFGLMSVTQLMTKQQFLNLTVGRLEAASTAMKMAKGGGGIAGMGGLLGKSGPLGSIARLGFGITKFLGPIGLATTAVAGLYMGFKFYQKKQEEARLKIEGLGDAALLSSNKLKTLGDFFGVKPQTTRMERTGPSLILNKEKRTQVDELKATPGFQKDFKNDIQSLKGATDTQAKLIFNSLAIQLKGKGFAKDNIDTILKALQEESGKTDLKLDFAQIDLSTKEGQKELQKSANTLGNSFGKQFGKGYSSSVQYVMNYSTGKIVTITNEKLSKGLQKNLALTSKSFAGMMNGLSGQLENGSINAEQFNQSFETISKTITSMPKPQALLLMDNVIKNLPGPLAKSALGIKNVKDQMLIAKAAALGVATITPAMINQLKAASTSADGAASRAASRVRRFIEGEMKGIQTVIDMVAKSAGKVTGGTDTGGTPKPTAAGNMREMTKAMMEQAKAYRILRNANVDAQTAATMAGDALIAAGIAASDPKKRIKVGSEAWTKLIEKLKEAQLQADATAARISLEKQKDDIQTQLGAYDKLIKAGYSAERAAELVGDVGLSTLIMNTAKAGTNFKDVKTLIDDVAAGLEKIKGIGDPFGINKIKEQMDVFNKNYDIMMEKFRIQEARVRQQFQPAIDKAQAAVEEAQAAIDKATADYAAKLDPITDRTNALNHDLSLIDHQAEAINEKYDAQAAALEQVNKLNQDAIAQGKQRISIADALSQGDIATAAQAIQDARAANAASNAQNQSDMLQKARQQELDNIKVNGLTRKQIEAELWDLSQKQYAIELERDAKLKDLNNKLEDAKTKLKDAEKTLADQLKKIEDQKTAWENAKLAIDEAQNSYEAMNITLTAQLALVNAIIAAWAAAQAAQAAAAAATTTTTTTTTSPTPGLNTTQQGILTTQSAAIQAMQKAGNTNAAEAATVTMMNDLAAVKPLASVDIVAARKRALGYLATGGMVPQYFAEGGGPKGTDTVPAWLTPGEYVINRKASRVFGPLLEAINTGEFPSFKIDRNFTSPSYGMKDNGGRMSAAVMPRNDTPIHSDNSNTVYNYSLSFNINGDKVNSNEIANTVINRIKQLQDQQVRGQVRL